MPLDVDEVAHGAVVHERVPAEDEGMVVDGRDRRARRRADVAEADPRLRVGADRTEVEVVQRRLDRLVHRRSQPLGSFGFREEGRGCRPVGLVNLLASSIRRCCRDIRSPHSRRCTMRHRDRRR